MYACQLKKKVSDDQNVMTAACIEKYVVKFV